MKAAARAGLGTVNLNARWRHCAGGPGLGPPGPPPPQPRLRLALARHVGTAQAERPLPGEAATSKFKFKFTLPGRPGPLTHWQVIWRNFKLAAVSWSSHGSGVTGISEVSH